MGWSGGVAAAGLCCFVLWLSLPVTESSVFSAAPHELSAEKQLIKDLVDTYKQVGVVGRPVRQSSDAITVRFGLALIQILSLDEKNQVLSISVWNRFEWSDYLLSWNPSDYDGITSVRIPPEDIWKPDIVLYNYADDRLKELRHAYAVITYDGTVTWIPSSIYKSSCSIDIANFPFDSQTCELKFSSWTYDGTKLDLAFYQNLSEFSLNDYVPSNEWDLIGSPARRNVLYYPCCEEPFPDLTFTLRLRRQVAFYSYILILPCVLLSLLTMILFWLPPESPAKMQLGINIFVAFFVLLLLLADSTPPAASSVPMIGVYYCFNMIMITVSTFLAVFIIHLYFRGPRTNGVPPWIKKWVLGRLIYLLFMRNYVPEEKSRRSCPLSDRKTKPLKIEQSSYNKLRPVRIRIDQSAAGRRREESVYASLTSLEPDDASPDMSPLHLYPSLQSDVRRIRLFVKSLIDKQKSQDQLEKARGEWRTTALVLDRAFFVLYILCITISLAVMYPRGD